MLYWDASSKNLYSYDGKTAPQGVDESLFIDQKQKKQLFDAVNKVEKVLVFQNTDA